MNALVKNCGTVHLSMKKEGNDIMMFDANETWITITGKLDAFVATICGRDLEGVAIKYAEELYLREVKRAINKKKSNQSDRKRVDDN